MTLDHASKILIVDDTIEDLQLLALRIRKANYIVFEAQSGKSALELLTQVEPDLLLLDVRMPDMDGFTVCKQIKAIPAYQHLPIIFLTSLSTSQDKVHGFTVGGVDFITKPPHISEVLARIETHLSLSYLRHQLCEQNERLEAAVHQRTAALHAELLRRRQNEQEKDKLLEVVRQQSEQLRSMTNLLIKAQQIQRTDLLNTLDTTVEDTHVLLRRQLELIQQLSSDLTEQHSSLLIYEHAITALELLQQMSGQVQAVTTSLHEPEVNPFVFINSPLLKLTAREREVLQLVANGKSNSAIAELLYLSEATVRTHRCRIMQKLELSDMSDLIKFAIKHKLTTIS